jgi:hypothetical protein
LRVETIGSRVAGAAGRGKPVSRVIAEGEGAVGGEIAVAIIGWRDGADRRVLVQRVGGVVDRARCANTL